MGISTSRKVKLNHDQQKLMMTLPESGMGFHLVDLHLTDGSVLKNRLILNCTYIVLLEAETIDNKSIDTITISDKTNSGES